MSGLQGHLELPGFQGDRAGGILLHPSSLPGNPIGSLGSTARQFVDWLAAAGVTYWQILPLVPVDGGGSPYNGLSAFAGNTLLISARELVLEGLLDEADIDAPPVGPGMGVDYSLARDWMHEVLSRALEKLKQGRAGHIAKEVQEYNDKESSWMEGYCLFRAIRAANGEESWTTWPAELRDRDPSALAAVQGRLREEIELQKFGQFIFERQWQSLREYARGMGVLIIGDIPIFVAHDSADVWANRELFRLDAAGQPDVVAGVPPDYFSETGQRWGNPIYRWDLMAERDYAWWSARFRRALALVDVVRIDHFRGFESFWAIPADQATAIGGEWEAGPGDSFFHSIQRQLGVLPVIAEDLGIITREVEELRDRLGLPGMRVVQFAFDGDPENPHLPENHPYGSVAFTATHDNDTTWGWWQSMSDPDRARVAESLGIEVDNVWAIIEAVLASEAGLAILPLQDVLELGSGARMNTPGMPMNNWSWQTRSLPNIGLAARLRAILEKTGRVRRP